MPIKVLESASELCGLGPAICNGGAVFRCHRFPTPPSRPLFSMHPLDAAKCVESTGGDLERAAVRKEQMDQASWKAARNLQLRQSAAKEQNLVNKASRTRKR